ncbi:4-hydroxythreonine-4-phosphate dehydrogenase PdxA [Marivivens donghaensis]|uniref:4-hydroxythreonine-4-phosphate dehydrogenase n=1 Tax=Marivivens donghaensis TaxID=1699413 RepID=A0ABX0VXW4_9RHOB|nr:4-hydroxythreonine-4-phosphate dehydrogenase PdxA [Marivivens donghaensis]NIY72952.1 4-hydroxythreonine-4-phosphate dehydrogenase PdxA [Marivivens donghaensis]
MTVAISCGEPAGIGPEIAVRAWEVLREDVPMLWIGDPTHLPDGAKFEVVAQPEDAASVSRNALPVLARDFGTPRVPGVADPAHAVGVISSIQTAVQLTMTGRCAAMTTAPIHKKALADGANFSFPGHTEFLAALAGNQKVVMMLASEQLRVVPATIHIALKDVPAQFTPEVLSDTVRITARGLIQNFGIREPRIAIAGLNPHAGEGGKMGTEELQWMNATVDALRAEGFNLRGPMPPDTMFHAAARQTYDAAICAYHDQALIPIKTIDFDNGVNVTLGLPFIRTSPDHGTAFDIAGTGKANPSSMIAAIRMAHKMAQASHRQG